MEHFVKMVNKLLNKHTPFKTFNKEPNMCSSKPWRATDITKSIKVRDNYIKIFINKENQKRKQGNKTNSRPIGTIFPLFLHAQKIHIAKDFLKKKKSKQSGKQLKVTSAKNKKTSENLVFNTNFFF